MKLSTFLQVVLFFSLSISCARPPEASTIPSDPEKAAIIVRSTFEAEIWKPESTAIEKVEYFPNSPQRYFLVTFTPRNSKSYLFEGLAKETFQEWKQAKSAGQFYHAKIKGKYGFGPQG